MKTKALSVAALARAALVAARGALAGEREAARDARSPAPGATFVVAARLAVDSRHYGSTTGYDDPVQPDRLRRRHRGDHDPHGRLRRVRRAADAGPVRGVQGLRPDPVGAVRRRRSPTTCRALPNNLKLTGPVDREDLPGPDHELERPGDQGAQPGRRTCPTRRSRRSTARTTRARPTTSPTTSSAVSPAWKSKVGTRRQRQLARPGVGGRGSSGVAGVVTNTEGAIGYVDIAFALANKHQVRVGAGTRPASSSPRACARSRRRRRTVTKVPANNELHIVNPPKIDAARLPDLHVHVRDPADEDGQGGRAAQVRLLGADPGPEVRAEAALRADPEGRAGRVREDAEAGQGLEARVRRSPRPASRTPQRRARPPGW